MDLSLTRASLVTAQSAIGEAIAQLDTPDVTIVRSGDSLQPVLDKGGAIVLDGTFAGTFFPRSKTSITCRPGTRIIGAGGPGLDILPGTKVVAINGDLQVTATTANAAIRIGNNDATQTSEADAPTEIVLRGVVVPVHRRKRAFENHGFNVAMFDCGAWDVYDEGGRDSQALYWGNTPGRWLIDGGRWTAASEIFIAGGDLMKIPNVTPKGLELRNFVFSRPAGWRTDGVVRGAIKNGLELKNAEDVWIHNGVIDGCWANGQQGEAFMFTPALDGEKRTPPAQSGSVRNVLVEDVTVLNCSTLVTLMGRHYTSVTPLAASNVVFRRVKATLSRTLNGGRGQMATLVAEPNDITFEDCTVVQDGSSLIYYDHGSVLDPSTLAVRIGGKLGSLSIRRCRMTAPIYGINPGGVSNLRPGWQDHVGALDIAENTFGGSTAMMPVLGATNTFLTREAFDALLAGGA